MEDIVGEAFALHMTLSTDTPGSMATTDQMLWVNCTCPSLLQTSGSLSLCCCLRALWGCMTLIHSLNLLFFRPGFVLICLPLSLRDKLPRYALQNNSLYLCVSQAVINPRDIQGKWLMQDASFYSTNHLHKTLLQSMRRFNTISIFNIITFCARFNSVWK